MTKAIIMGLKVEPRIMDTSQSNPTLQSMKPEIYATKKAIAPITIAMVRMIRSSLVIPANMTQDRGISFEYTVDCRAPQRNLRGYSLIHISCPVAAFRSPRKGGLGRCGRDLNSGWYCVPTK